MKSTLEIPAEVIRQSKVAAARRGESLKDFVVESLRRRLAEGGPDEAAVAGWRRVFGQATLDQVADVDGIVAEELRSVAPDAWR